MCLITANRTPKVAQEDITCYKILEAFHRRDSWKTPFLHFAVEFDKLLTDKNEVVLGKIEIDSGYNMYSVEKGCFHTFCDTNDAHKFTCSGRDFCYRVFKCVIPKGTEYYSGTSFDVDCYASKKLIITKEQV